MIVKDISARDFWIARKRITPYITRTPLVYSPGLSEKSGANVWLKMENLQEVGAFKIRGAANKILSLTPEERSRGVAAFSTGNHGMAVACIARRLGIKATVCMSRNVPQVKVDNIKRWGAEILQNWESQDDAGRYCFETLEKKEGMTVIPPFDDREIICGQGTISLELLEDFPEVDTVLVPLSGGGLISGITLGLKLNLNGVEVVGISMERSAVMIESLKAGHPVELPEEETLADSLLGGIGLENRYTFDITREYVDRTAQVSEHEIAAGIAYVMGQHKLIVEGASAVGAALALRNDTRLRGRNIAIVVTGCGIAMETVKKILNGE
ncbi:MAG: threonine/serine dehydratase [Spirochaetaceae bacterium]|jgi:threonine dehydratase|nr:threonine/serine dehydratase [Spirochaetaceae bacterium]